MAEREIMYWVSSQKRWLKEYRGKTYSRSAKQLGTAPTKEASRKAANDWWDKKQQEIDLALGAAKKHPAHITDHYETAIENWRLFAKWHRRYGELAKTEHAETFIEFLETALQENNPPYPLPPEQQKPIDLMTEVLGEDWIIWQERFRQIKHEEAAEQSVPKANTIRAHIDDYLVVRKAQNKPGSYDTFSTRLTTFRKWVDPLAPIDSINEALWERFCVHLSQQVTDGKMAAATMAGTQGAARAFIRSRWERRFIDLPRNLNSRALAASVPLKNIVLFTTKEIKQLLADVTERNRLLFLLMLNCGMYPVDIAMLRHHEVDWKTGRIVRQRTKTRNRSGNVPKVDYLLWRETFGLLKKHRSSHPELVLVNENGSPLWVESVNNGKFCRNNNIRTLYFRLQEKMKIPKEQRKPLKSIRKTASSRLEDHKEYGRYAEYFLGEAPTSVAGRHYVKPSTKQFDSAIRWLGKQFGIS